jgi:hypothetical protein
VCSDPGSHFPCYFLDGPAFDLFNQEHLMMNRTLFGLAVSVLLMTGIVAQPENQKRITMDQKRQAVTELARSLRAVYAIAQIAETGRARRS